MDSFVVQSLLSTNKIKFHLHLLQVTISCKFPLFWINNLKVIELFKFFNSQIKLLDWKTLSNEILANAVKKFDTKILGNLVLNRTGITFSFNG